jgi:outer membrane immunogenic protein
MKKLLLLSFCLLMLSASSIAQPRLGGMLGYGSEAEQWGLGVNGEFFLSNRVSASPGLFFYIPEKNKGVKRSFWEINGNFHYYFLEEDFIELYGLAGLNLTSFRVRTDDEFLDGRESSDSELGVNFGLGANFDAGAVVPYAELKYTASALDQAVIFIGLKFPLRQ